MMKKIVILLLTVVVLGALAYVLLLRDATTPSSDESVTSTPPVVTESAAESGGKQVDTLIIGNPDAPITIVEYADYKCPECGKFYQNAGKDIRKNYVETGKAKIEFRPYPLFGADSGLALYASYCALEQDKFTAYHDKMFQYMWENYYAKGDNTAETATLFSPEKLGQLAGEAGLDKAAFTTCAGGRTHEVAYNTAVDKAAGDSVQGTPTILIEEQKIVGPQPFNVYRALLELAGRA